MLYLLIKAGISGILIAIASDVARRWPGWGALIVSLPLVSVLTIIWLWRDTGDPERVAAHVGATFWFVLPSLPMFLLMPWLLRQGYSFWLALIAGCALTIALYLAMVHLGPKFGLRL
jgi:hypothetical protein